MQTEIQDYFNGLCCAEPEVTYNFDVTANWETGDISYPVTDQASFETFLANRGSGIVNNLTSISITNFSLVGNRLQCNLTANGTTLNLIDMNITECLSFGNINGLQQLYLNSNQIVTFNPTIALPSSLQVLELSSNQIVTFNPTLALPSSLQYLSLEANQIVTFNPTLALPTSLIELKLKNNQMTTVGYTTSEPWANGMHNAPSGGFITFFNNTNSVSGTNLETILTNKGWTVTV
jgi:hypothetical protein